MKNNILIISGIHEKEAKFGLEVLSEFETKNMLLENPIYLYEVIDNKGSCRSNLRRQCIAYGEAQGIVNLTKPSLLIDIHHGISSTKEDKCHFICFDYKKWKNNADFIFKWLSGSFS